MEPKVALITVVTERTEGSSCCCALGQTPEEVAALKEALEGCGVEVQVVDLTNPDQYEVLSDGLKEQVDKFLVLYGALAFPMLALDGQIVALGVAEPSQAVEALTEALRKKGVEQ